jgi:hypothetical protein
MTLTPDVDLTAMCAHLPNVTILFQAYAPAVLVMPRLPSLLLSSLLRLLPMFVLVDAPNSSRTRYNQLFADNLSEDPRTLSSKDIVVKQTVCKRERAAAKAQTRLEDER